MFAAEKGRHVGVHDNFSRGVSHLCRKIFFDSTRKTAMLANLTRQLSCRKEDRVMRPIYGCPEKF